MAVDDDEIQSYLLAEARVKLWLEEVNEYELPDFWPDLQVLQPSFGRCTPIERDVS